MRKCSHLGESESPAIAPQGLVLLCESPVTKEKELKMIITKGC
jgi:hypothetical protein